MNFQMFKLDIEAGRGQPGEGRGREQSSARSLLLEGDGPARLQAPILPGVGVKN